MSNRLLRPSHCSSSSIPIPSPYIPHHCIGAYRPTCPKINILHTTIIGSTVQLMGASLCLSFIFSLHEQVIYCVLQFSSHLISVGTEICSSVESLPPCIPVASLRGIGHDARKRLHFFDGFTYALYNLVQIFSMHNCDEIRCPGWQAAWRGLG